VFRIALWALAPWCACLLVCGPAARADSVAPTGTEARALREAKGAIPGQIVWESNREGDWHLYAMNADGTGARRLTDGPGSDIAARFSPDGKRIVFARAADQWHSDVWIMAADGTDARLLIPNATGPVWRKGGEAIQFQRRAKPGADQYQVWEYDLARGNETMLFPREGVDYEAGIWEAIGDDRGSRFVAWSPRPRGTWVLSPDGSVQTHVHPGCMGQVDYDQRYGYGVREPGCFVRFDLATGKDTLDFNQLTGPWSHSYFPRISSDGQWLAYAACPPNQHNQDTSGYEVFVVRMEDWVVQGERVRLTFNTRTDRAPDLCVVADRLPDGPYDMAQPPTELPILSFASEDAGPDIGGTFGLWPTEGACTATATWVDQDAAGGEGGSMRIDYRIGGEPNSVALWVAPQGASMDLSAFDVLRIRAKGTVSSFTMVVEDSTAEGDGGAKGTADYVVEGVTDGWQEFEMPLADFTPRERGGSVDWTQVRTVAIALIAPRNARSGSLQVDSIAAGRAP